MALNKTSIILSFVAFLTIFFAQAGFVKGTVVKTSSGFVPIEELNIGDEVYCFDMHNDEFLLRTITDVSRHEVSYLLYIQTNGTHIIVDAQQPFYLPVEEAWCYAEDLQPSMVLLSCDQQRIMVQNVNEVCINALVYDITVDELHNFCVTTDGIVVHNFFWVAIPLTLSLSKIAYSLGVALVAYTCYDFVQKNTGASNDLNIDLSNAHFSGLIDPYSSQKNQRYGHDGYVHLGNESSHSNAVFASNQSQESISSVPTYAARKLPQSPSVHDTRSYAVPKIESEKILGCGTGLLPASPEFDQNKPSCIQGIDNNGGRTCNPGLLIPVPKTNLGELCEVSGSKDDDADTKLPTCGIGLQPIPESRTLCSWSNNSTKLTVYPEKKIGGNQESDAETDEEEAYKKYDSEKIDVDVGTDQQEPDHQDKEENNVPLKEEIKISLEETVRAIKELVDQNPEKIWSKITPTQEFHNSHSLIPKSFVINVEGQLIWVNPSGSKHLMEETSPPLSASKRKDAKPLRQEIDPLISPWDIPAKEYKFSHELLLNDFYEDLQAAIKPGVKYGELIIINSWEFKFDYPSIENGHPILFHALKVK